MALIMNATVDPVSFKVFGNHFSLKPGQMKTFQDSIVREVELERKHLGLVTLGEEFEDPDYRSSAEAKSIIEQKKKDGIKARCDFLRMCIYNNQVSLKNDLDRANLKIDPRSLASDGEIRAMEELVKYQRGEEDETQKKIDRIKELEKQIKVQG